MTLYCDDNLRCHDMFCRGNKTCCDVKLGYDDWVVTTSCVVMFYTQCDDKLYRDDNLEGCDDKRQDVLSR